MADDNTSDYYDKVDEAEHARSAENHSIPDPESRDLWQTANVATDGSGPRLEDVAPVFAQARADALANPVTADSNDEALANENAQSAEDAQAKADELRASPGYVAPTGAEADQYDDPTLEEKVPAENFNAAPAEDENAETADDEVVEEDNTEANAPESTPEAPTSNVPEDTNHDGVVDENEARAATEA